MLYEREKGKVESDLEYDQCRPMIIVVVSVQMKQFTIHTMQTTKVISTSGLHHASLFSSHVIFFFSCMDHILSKYM